MYPMYSYNISPLFSIDFLKSVFLGVFQPTVCRVQFQLSTYHVQFQLSLLYTFSAPCVQCSFSAVYIQRKVSTVFLLYLFSPLYPAYCSAISTLCTVSTFCPMYCFSPCYTACCLIDPSHMLFKCVLFQPSIPCAVSALCVTYSVTTLFIPCINLLLWIWEQQDWEVDQEIDGKMRWERMEEWLAENGGRKKYITERNGRSSWERQGIVAFCTSQWNEWINLLFHVLLWFNVQSAWMLPSFMYCLNSLCLRHFPFLSITLLFHSWLFHRLFVLCIKSAV